MIFNQPRSTSDFNRARKACRCWKAFPPFIVLCVAVFGFGGLSNAADYQDAIKQLEDAIRTEVRSKSLPAFSIALVDDQKTVWSAGYGFQDTEKQVPATSETIYRVGSISKLFTDIAVMQLVEQGKLDLDAPVQEYLPSFRPIAPPGTQLTLRQMMMHRSGLVRESPVGNYFDPTEPSLAKTVASLNRTKLVYPPETKTKYSNAAIAVVGAVLESQLDTSHPQQVRNSILDPLGMDHSSFTSASVPREHLAVGWMRTHDGRRPFVAPDFLLGTGPAGNLYSSVNDLAKFLACLHDDCQTPDGQILDAKTFNDMITPTNDNDGGVSKFGLGFHVSKFDGHKKIGHGGAVYGFSTQFASLPQRRLGVVAASSLDGTNGVVRRLSDYALRLMLACQDGQSLPKYIVTGPVPPQRARQLVGRYQNSETDQVVRISELAGDVFLRRGQSRYTLRTHPQDGRLITDDETSFGIDVEREGDDALVIGGTRYEKMPDVPPPNVPERWRGLIGEYGWDHNTLYILEDHGQLFALIEWFYYYPLKEIDRDTFAFPDTGLYHGEALKFERGSDDIAKRVVAAEVEFERRDVGTKDGQTFQIEPVVPIDQLRPKALAATPPQEPGTFRESDLIDVTTVDPTLRLDIRYATTNNFTGSVFYNQPRAFMQRPAADALAAASESLKKHGLGLMIHDAYRPWYVTKMFWDATPADMKDFVANPANGSRHNRGCAVDLTLYDIETKQPIQMVAGYDEFSKRAFPLYPGGTSRQRYYRDLLRRTMEQNGFTVYEFEWWHFDFNEWRRYRIGNLTFEQIDQSADR